MEGNTLHNIDTGQYLTNRTLKHILKSRRDNLRCGGNRFIGTKDNRKDNIDTIKHTIFDNKDGDDGFALMLLRKHSPQGINFWDIKSLIDEGYEKSTIEVITLALSNL